MKRALPYGFLLALSLPSCVVYSDGIFADEPGTGGATGGSSTGSASGGGSDTGGTGGAPSGGAGDTGGTSSGASATGGDASGSSGNTGGATGGAGTGGEACSLGSTPAYDTALEVALADTFDTSWPTANNDTGGTWDGYWSANGDAGAASSISPMPASSTSYSKGAYEELCDADDLAMHITASGSTGYGVGFDLKLKANGGNVDLSQYTGVIMYLKSSNATTVKLGLTDAASPTSAIEKPIPPIGATFKVVKMAFAPYVTDGLVKSEVAILKFIAYNNPVDATKPFDLWIDDIGFYK